MNKKKLLSYLNRINAVLMLCLWIWSGAWIWNAFQGNQHMNHTFATVWAFLMIGILATGVGQIHVQAEIEDEENRNTG